MIDLELPSYGCEPCCVSSDSQTPRKYYPNFHYEGENDIDLPEEGTMTIKFKRTSREERDRDGKKRYSYSVDVLGIDKVDGAKAEVDDKPAKSYDEASSALDKIAEQLSKKK
jgi:hypothetical protein